MALMLNTKSHRHIGYVFSIALLRGEFRLYIYEPDSRKIILNTPVVDEVLGENAAVVAAHKFIDAHAKTKRAN
jgi:hypothetical protein